MVEIDGRMLIGGWGYFDAVDALQKSICVDWLERAFPERCAKYDEQAWHALARELPTRPMHFCIDRFEYPDRLGDHPWARSASTT
jgi:hypothetical protein